MWRRRGRAFAAVFADAVRFLAQDYARFVAGAGRLQPEDDPKDFAARHAPARACLSHLEQLLDMIGEDGGGGGGAEQLRDGLALLSAARQALALPAPPPEGAPVPEAAAGAGAC